MIKFAEEGVRFRYYSNTSIFGGFGVLGSSSRMKGVQRREQRRTEERGGHRRGEESRAEQSREETEQESRAMEKTGEAS